MPIGDDKHIVAEEPAASVYWPNKLSEALPRRRFTARRWTLWRVGSSRSRTGRSSNSMVT